MSIIEDMSYVNHCIRPVIRSLCDQLEWKAWTFLIGTFLPDTEIGGIPSDWRIPVSHVFHLGIMEFVDDIKNSTTGSMFISVR
jgi:hypothetical protein